MSRASRAEERRRHLIDVTRRLFAQQGFHATGVAQIAAASGIKVGQIYRDFASKEDLIAALVAEDLAQFLDEEGLHRAVGAGDRVAVRLWLNRFFATEKSVEDCRLVSEIHVEAARNERIAEIHAQIDRTVRSQIMAALSVLIVGENGEPRREGVSDLVMLLGAGLMNRRMIDPSLDTSKMRATIARIIDAALQEAAPPIR